MTSGNDQLEKFYPNEESKMDRHYAQSCNYIGYLINEPEACAAVTGCLNKEDMFFTIHSKVDILYMKIGAKMFFTKWTLILVKV